MVKIKDIPKLSETHDFTLVFCTFLDDFKRTANKFELIADEPQRGILKKKDWCMLACAAHKLARDNGLQTPEWVYDKKFVMPKPVYAFNTKNEEYKKLLKETSPEEYSSRNIYYGDRVLQRV